MSVFLKDGKYMDGYRIDYCDACPYLDVGNKILPHNPYFCNYYRKYIQVDILRKKPDYCKVKAFYIELGEEK